MIFATPENITTMQQVLAYGDSVAGGFLGLLILLTITFTVFLLTSAFGGKEALLVSSFVGSIFALFLWILELLSLQFLLISITVYAASMTVVFFKTGGVR